ncbi:IS66 family transposase [Anaeromicropila populeti]|uniref:Transposase n=1 Tax=Anaeromicropila populeti TaxID=37658 RepID=A0A1I6K758_9FIRM|nr:IS66 family transposase [Anaeromicropila populeti]SFR87063.1 Transposase [Anaeromicropila populeti]
MTEAEELLKLRALLAEKEQVIEEQRIQIDNMIQALLHARKKMFGASSERTQMDGQMSLFESVQELARELLKEQKKISVKSYEKTPRKSGVREEMLSGIPKEIEEYIINEEETCPKCGGSLKIIGKQIVRVEVEWIPAKLKVKQIVRQVAKCEQCGKKGSDNKTPVFVKANVPSPVLSHSLSTPSLVAQIMYQKFAMGLPCNRLEKDWFRMGLVLTRADMAYWIIRCSEEWLTPIYQKIHEQLLSCEVLHMDETRIQCNKEEGRKASSDSFMWVMRSAASEAVQAAYFHYSTSRSTEVASRLIGNYNGYLITDAYSGYNKAGSYIRCMCWAHCRRYFIESIPLDNNGKEIPGSKGAEGREYINLLFQIEKTSSMHTTNEKLTEALTYATNQRKYLETFLEDGRIPLSNNLCEANIKPFATARRAWLFVDTPKGAKANAVLYTLVETAKANKLDVYEYLKYLLEVMPNNNHLQHPEVLNRYLPWSKELPEQCRLQVKHKKCFNK